MGQYGAMWKGCQWDIQCVDVGQWGGVGVGASVGLVTTNGHVGRSQVRSWHPSGKYGQPRGHGHRGRGVSSHL